MTIHREDASFEAALEDCCRRVRQGESLANCLPDYPQQYREEVARLVPLSERVASLGRDPSPEFQARLERRLLARVQQAAKSQRVGLRRLLPLPFPMGTALRSAVATTAVLLVLALSGVGAVSASADSLPDSPLYPVKVAKEWVQLAMARDGEAKVNVRANQIVQRGRELQKAVQEEKPPRVVEALTLALGRSTEGMVDLALELRTGGKTQQAARALAALRNMRLQAVHLALEAQPDSRPILRRLISYLDAQERRLEQGKGAPLQQPSSEAVAPAP